MMAQGDNLDARLAELATLEARAHEMKRARASKSPLAKAAKSAKALLREGPAGLARRRAVAQADRTLPPRADEPTPAWQNRPGCYLGDQRIVVYMAPFGGYDQVREPWIVPDNIDYRLVTTDVVPGTSAWKHVDPSDVMPPEVAGDPVLANRWCKMHPHLLFPQHQTSIYLDSNFLVASDLTALAAGLGAYPVAMFRHKQRTCVYDEIRACIVKGKAPREDLEAHERLLRDHGVPQNRGFLEAPVIVRNHADQRCVDLMDAWWSAFLAGPSRRDQIALADALWQLGVEPGTIGTLGPDFRACDLLVMLPHGAAQKGGAR